MQTTEIETIVQKLQAIPSLIPLPLSNGIEIEFIEHLQNTLRSFIEPFELGIVNEEKKQVFEGAVYIAQCLIDSSESKSVVNEKEKYISLIQKQNNQNKINKEKLQEQHLKVYQKFKDAIQRFSQEREITTLTLAKGA